MKEQRLAAAFQAWRKSRRCVWALPWRRWSCPPWCRPMRYKYLCAGGIISGGFTGLGMLVERWELKGINIRCRRCCFLNIPVALLCCKGISVRFTAVSLAQVALTSFFLQVCSFAPIFVEEFLNVIFGGVVMGPPSSLPSGKCIHWRDGFYRPLCIEQDGTLHMELCILGNALMYCLYGVSLDGNSRGIRSSSSSSPRA